MYKTINYNEIKNISNALIIDVRDFYEYNIKHLDKAINIPLDMILTVLNKYNKDQNLIIYCKNGIRSKKACEILVQFNYKNIYNLINVEKYL